MNDYPIHWSVFENDASLLKEYLAKTSKVNLMNKKTTYLYFNQCLIELTE